MQLQNRPHTGQQTHTRGIDMKVLSQDTLEQLGLRLKSKFAVYDGERQQLEQQWLKNLRQYKAIYDPEVKIPEGKSKVYPKDTHTKIVGWVAKMMEMMFPAQEKNWSLWVTAFPNIEEGDLSSIINTLTAQQMVLSEQNPEAGLQPVTPDMIEKAVKEFAKQRAARMEMECEDQLADDKVDYPELCKKIIRRGGIYGYGVAEGPMVKTQEERTWGLDPLTGQFKAVAKQVPRPFYEVLKVWDVYPDLSAQKWGDQEGLFVRKAYSRQGLRALAAREDFFEDVINKFLKDNETGNYKARSYEAQLHEIKKTDQNPPDMITRQYEVIRWYGFVSAQDLKDIGAKIPDKALGKDILADVWLLGDTVIKADTAPFGEGVADMFHVFIHEEDEDAPLTGSSKVETLRDSQMKLCAIDRATMDNMAESASSIKEVNEDLVHTNDRGKKITGGMTIRRNGEGVEANAPAIRIYDIPNHTAQLLELRKSVLEVFDVESHLPSWRMGNAQPLGEAFRTSNNMSIMAGGGDMVTKDDARAFDRFVKSFIGSLVKWNMEFNEKTDIKGDYQVMPKGTMSLVAKEVRGAALDQMMQTMTPRQLVMIDERGIIEDRFKARDLSLDRLKSPEDAAKALAQFDQQQAAAAQTQQGLDESKTQMQLASAQEKAAKAQEITETLKMKVNEGLSRIAQNLAKAKGEKDKAALQSIQLLMEQINGKKEGASNGSNAQQK